MSLSAWHILTSQYFTTLLCKNAPNLSDCEGISCAQPSPDHPTDFQSDSDLGFGWDIIIFWWSHSFVDLDVCFGLLSCWEMKCLSIFRCLAEAWRFCAVLTGIWNCSYFPPPWLSPQFQLKKNMPKAWCCHHPASLWVRSSFGDVQCCFCAEHTF